MLVWADQVGLARTGQGSPDMEVVRWAAAVHDVGRLTDGRDAGHGSRSAEWVEANGTLLEPGLTLPQQEQLAYICRWHVPDDNSAPEMTAELACLKDADGLDRVRIWDLDPRRLRSAAARDLAKAAKQLFSESQRMHGDPWEAARTCAQAMGLWR